MTLAVALSLCSLLALATEEDYSFKDNRGNEIIVPKGAASFATRVVSFTPGSPWTSDPLDMDPDEILGIPDRAGHSNGKAITLGAGGVIVLEFGIQITDGDGNDIYVFEVGNRVEATRVEVSDDLENWIYVGDADGSISGVDMNEKIPEGGAYRYVRITDRDGSSGNYPGADIDAVAGLSIQAIPEEPDDPDDVTDPTDPTDPADLTDPTDPVDPVDPTDPTDPTDPDDTKDYQASDWALEEIQRADELGLIPDSLVGTDLTRSITRAEFAAVAVKAYEALSGTVAIPIVNNPFVDTKDVEVLKAYNVGAVNGTSATTFEPDMLLNREQAATMLTRVFKRITLAGWTLETDSQFTLPYTMPVAFADDGDISNWARDSVYFMSAHDIILGVGGNRFAPKNVTTQQESIGYANATREQALLIAVRMVENLAA